MKKVFVVGYDSFNVERLKRIPRAQECEFYPALEWEDFRGVDKFDIKALIEKANLNIHKICEVPDAIITYWDFPASSIVPILVQQYGLRGPSLRSVMKCEHKFWSRMEQRKVIIDHIPEFQAVDPFDDDAYSKLTLITPFWIKPFKSFRSFLAYRINDERDFHNSIENIRSNIEVINEPFQYLMERYRMPEMFTHMNESCICESLLTGSMCTLEGYVHEGEVVGYGIVDSVREGDRSSFSRYEYPSSLPPDVQFRMHDIAKTVIQQIGLDDAPFNIEFFYNQTMDQIYLLEINPRMSQAHTDIFEKVHGFSHHKVALDLALGLRPGPMERKGKFSIAAHFMHRSYESGMVKRVPTQEEIESLKNEVPGFDIKINANEGHHLNEMKNQDSYSYELASIFLGGRDQIDLLDKYDYCLNRLNFEIEIDKDWLAHAHRVP